MMRIKSGRELGLATSVDRPVRRVYFALVLALAGLIVTTSLVSAQTPPSASELDY